MAVAHLGRTLSSTTYLAITLVLPLWMRSDAGTRVRVGGNTYIVASTIPKGKQSSLSGQSDAT